MSDGDAIVNGIQELSPSPNGLLGSGEEGGRHARVYIHPPCARVPLPDAFRAWYALDREMLQAKACTTALAVLTCAVVACGRGGNGSEVERVQPRSEVSGSEVQMSELGASAPGNGLFSM